MILISKIKKLLLAEEPVDLEDLLSKSNYGVAFTELCYNEGLSKLITTNSISKILNSETAIRLILNSSYENKKEFISNEKILVYLKLNHGTQPTINYNLINNSKTFPVNTGSSGNAEKTILFAAPVLFTGIQWTKSPSPVVNANVSGANDFEFLYFSNNSILTFLSFSITAYGDQTTLAYPINLFTKTITAKLSGTGTITASTYNVYYITDKEI